MIPLSFVAFVTVDISKDRGFDLELIRSQFNCLYAIAYQQA